MALVQFNQNGGLIHLMVKSGPPCLGEFRLWYRNNLIGNVSPLYPNEIHSIHDQYPDNFVLPFDLISINDITLRINGRYGPLPNYAQISVRYLFYQDGQILNVDPNGYNVIQDSLTAPPPYKQYIHDFTFQKI
ncbi:MAG: hypothetical protein SFU91_11980 [Chloroherpetonaceae bacterium]|nr:hypothetical protein [Chloroherpetonaceae bacterium]